MKHLLLWLILLTLHIFPQGYGIYGVDRGGMNNSNSKYYLWNAVTGSNIITQTDVFLYGAFTRIQVPKDSLDDFGNGDVRAGTKTASKYIVVVPTNDTIPIPLEEGISEPSFGHDIYGWTTSSQYLVDGDTIVALETDWIKQDSISQLVAGRNYSLRIKATTNYIGLGHYKAAIEGVNSIYNSTAWDIYTTDTTVYFVAGVDSVLQFWIGGLPTSAEQLACDCFSYGSFLLDLTLSELILPDSVRTLARNIDMADLIEDNLYTYYASILQPNGRYSKGADSTFVTPLTAPVIYNIQPNLGDFEISWDNNTDQQDTTVLFRSTDGLAYSRIATFAVDTKHTIMQFLILVLM
jgi:hypothetical protein